MSYLATPRKYRYEPESNPRELVDLRADWHLDNWARWMRAYEEVDGYDQKSAVVGEYRASTSLDEMYDSGDKNSAMICNAIIEESHRSYRTLTELERLAIKNVYLHSVYRFRGDFNTVFVEAVTKFWEMGQKRGLI